ncbi:MAG: MarR family winged helix-turn-helix transcriptional regulator [Atopobiaceae bacterium]|jgi:DNA-binding MarR family transcriptional regulator
MNTRFESFVGVIYALNKEIQRIKANRMREFGLRGMDTMVMYFLGEHAEGLTRAELARLSRCDRAAITRITEKLTSQGLISAQEGAGANYRTRIVLTPAGMRCAQDMEAVISCVVEEASKDISEAERAHMYETLGKILEQLEQLD